MSAASPSLWRDPATRLLVVLSILAFTSFALTSASLAPWAVEGGTSRGTAGAVTAAMLVSTVGFQTFVPVLERRWGLTAVLAGGLVALGAPSPLYALSHQLGWLVAVSVVRGAGFAVLTVLGSLLTSRIAPAERHGEVVGAYGLSVALPNLAAVPVGAALTLDGHFVWVAVLAVSPLLALPVLRRLSREGLIAAPQRFLEEVTGPSHSLRSSRTAAGPRLARRWSSAG